MTRLTPRPLAARLPAVLCLSVVGTLSAALAGGGCAAKPAPSPAPTVGTTDAGSRNQVFAPPAGTDPAVGEEALPKNKLAALQEADKLINDGEDEKAEAAKLKAAGKDQEAEAKAKSGDEKIANGTKLKAKAATIAD